MAYDNNFNRIQGVEYIRDKLKIDQKNDYDKSKIQTEYQLFPESYFSGHDVVMYFGDIWVDDITGLQFGLTEQVMPLYGYNSYTYDAALRGNRIVQGQFRIAFREAGYLYRIFEHIGSLQEKAVPQLAYELGGIKDAQRDHPEWAGGYQQTMEDLLDQVYGNNNEALAVKDPTLGWPNLQYKQSHDKVKDLQTMILNGEHGLRGPVPWPPENYPSFAGIKREEQDNEKVRLLNVRLNGYMQEIGLLGAPLPEGGFFSYDTEDALKAFQAFAEIPETGWVDDVTYQYLCQSMQVTGEYSLGTKLAIARFQRENNITEDQLGMLGTATKKALQLPIGLADPISRSKVPGGAAARDYADYESKIWGRAFDQTKSRYNEPYFYTSHKDPDQQKWLTIEGFDIYVNYGPLAQAIMIDNNNEVPSALSFETTVKAIRNIQITGVQQVINATGDPIEEVYTFMARDLD